MFPVTGGLMPAVACFMALAAGGAVAQTTTTAPQRVYQDPRAIINVQVENDLVANTDRGYTSGIRLSYLTPETTLPNWIDRAASALPFFSREGQKRVGFALGQSIYTPDDISDATPDPDDRPYAGLLYGTIGVISDTGLRVDSLELMLGMIGPASLAEETQKLVHEIIGSQDPKGWKHQLHNEPALMLTYERKWRGMYQFNPYGFGADASPYVGGSLGNVFTQAAAGMMLRIGQDLPADYGPPRIKPSLPGSDFFIPTRDFGWYLFAGIEARAVLWNVFLDGNTFRDSPSVDKNWLVGDFQFGLAATFAGIRLAYTHVFRTKEFHGQDGIGEFGALTVSFRF